MQNLKNWLGKETKSEEWDKKDKKEERQKVRAREREDGVYNSGPPPLGGSKLTSKNSINTFLWEC